MAKRPQDLPPPPSDLLDLPLGDRGGAPQLPLRRAGDLETIGSLDRRRRPPRTRGAWLWLILLLAFPIGALVGYFLSSEPPLAVLSDSLLDFGEVRLGRSGDDQVIRIANHGEEVLWLASAGLEGEAAAEFAITSDGCAGLEIEALEACEVRLAFRPGQGGPRRARLRVDSNAINGQQSVALSGVGVRPELNVEPAQLDFGRQVIGRGGASADLRVDNRGTAALYLGRIELTGGAAADFLRVSDDCGARDLAPGGRCVVRFTFVPRAEGERRATVRIESDANDQPIEVSLIGQGLDHTPVLRLDPERLDFGGIAVSEASPSQVVKIANDGQGPLTVRRVQLTELPYGGVYEIVSENCTHRPVPPSRACDITVRFRPADESSAQSYLTIDSTAGQKSVRVSLSGFGTAPHARFDPSRLSFGEVGVRIVSAPRLLRIASTGGVSLGVGEIQLTGTDAESFAAQGCSATSVPPGSECVVEVFFRPRRAGPHRAELIVRHDADDRQQRIRLNGLGAVSNLSLDPGEVDFSDVTSGTSSRRRVELRSSGRSGLEIRRLRLTASGSEFELNDDRCSNKTLPPGRTCSVVVVFKPTSSGVRNVRLEIEHSGGSTQIPIRASAIE